MARNLCIDSCKWSKQQPKAGFEACEVGFREKREAVECMTGLQNETKLFYSRSGGLSDTIDSINDSDDVVATPMSASAISPHNNNRPSDFFNVQTGGSSDRIASAAKTSMKISRTPSTCDGDSGELHMSSFRKEQHINVHNASCDESDSIVDTPTVMESASGIIGSGFCFSADAIVSGSCGEDDDADYAATRLKDGVKSTANENQSSTSKNKTGNSSSSGNSIWQTLTSTYSLQRSNSTDETECDVVVASTALMGENIIDSPVQSSPSSRSNRNRLLRSEIMKNKMPSAPNLGAASNRQATTIGPLSNVSKRSSSSDSVPTATTTTSPHSSTSASQPNALSVGIMAQGLAWARRQRDRRQRQYLQHQAEQQLHKIRQAHEKERKSEQIATSTLLDNPTFQNLMHITPSKAAMTTSNVKNVTNGSVTAGSSVSYDTHSSDGRPKGPLDVSQSDSTSCFAVSTSGDGYSVALPMDLTMDEINAEEDASFIPAVRVEEEGDIETCPFLLSLAEMQQIAERVLPRGIAYCKWKRLYSLARDGDSFDACLRNVSSEKQTVLVVRTSRDAIFGGFADAPWGGDGSAQGFGASYYGGPSACLFRIDPVTRVAAATTTTCSVSTGSADSSEHPRDENVCEDNPGGGVERPRQPSKRNTVLKCYPWTGANRYIQLCDAKNKMLAFGGGGNDGSFGLCVEQDFQLGSTGSCATFDNDPLCDQESFEILDVEIYGFLVGQF